MSHIDTHHVQTLLFPDFLSDRRAAIEADISASGGLQVVGVELGLDEDPIEAGKKLSNKVQRNGRHDLKDDEVWRIRELARQRAGRSRLHEMESSALNFEGKWLTCEDIKARKKKRIAALMAELQKELAQVDE
jgi:hypothetical protein